MIEKERFLQSVKNRDFSEVKKMLQTSFEQGTFSQDFQSIYSIKQQKDMEHCYRNGYPFVVISDPECTDISREILMGIMKEEKEGTHIYNQEDILFLRDSVKEGNLYAFELFYSENQMKYIDAAMKQGIPAENLVSCLRPDFSFQQIQQIVTDLENQVPVSVIQQYNKPELSPAEMRNIRNLSFSQESVISERSEIQDMAVKYQISEENAEVLLKYDLSPEQIEEIKPAFSQKLPQEQIELLCSSGYDENQIREVCTLFNENRGLSTEVVRRFFHKDIEANEMAELRSCFDYKLSMEQIELISHPTPYFGAAHMRELRTAMFHGMSNDIVSMIVESECDADRISSLSEGARLGMTKEQLAPLTDKDFDTSKVPVIIDGIRYGVSYDDAMRLTATNIDSLRLSEGISALKSGISLSDVKDFVLPENSLQEIQGIRSELEKQFQQEITKPDTHKTEKETHTDQDTVSFEPADEPDNTNIKLEQEFGNLFSQPQEEKQNESISFDKTDLSDFDPTTNQIPQETIKEENKLFEEEPEIYQEDNPVQSEHHDISSEKPLVEPTFREQYNAEKLGRMYPPETVQYMMESGCLNIADDKIVAELASLANDGFRLENVAFLLEENEHGEFIFSPEQMREIHYALKHHVTLQQIDFMCQKDKYGRAFFSELDMKQLNQAFLNRQDVIKLAKSVNFNPQEMDVFRSQTTYEKERFIGSFEDAKKIAAQNIVIPGFNGRLIEKIPKLDRFLSKLGNVTGYTYLDEAYTKPLTREEKKKCKRISYRLYHQLRPNYTKNSSVTSYLSKSDCRRIVKKMVLKGLDTQLAFTPGMSFDRLYQIEKMMDAQITPERIRSVIEMKDYHTVKRRDAFGKKREVSIDTMISAEKMMYLRQLELQGVDMIVYQDLPEKELKKMSQSSQINQYLSNLSIYGENASFGIAYPEYKDTREQIYQEKRERRQQEKAKTSAQTETETATKETVHTKENTYTKDKMELCRETEELRLKNQSNDGISKNRMDVILQQDKNNGLPGHFIYMREERDALAHFAELVDKKTFQELSAYDKENDIPHFNAKEIYLLGNLSLSCDNRQAVDFLIQTVKNDEKGFLTPSIEALCDAVKEGVNISTLANSQFTEQDIRAVTEYYKTSYDQKAIQGFDRTDKNGCLIYAGKVEEFIIGRTEPEQGIATYDELCPEYTPDESAFASPEADYSSEFEQEERSLAEELSELEIDTYVDNNHNGIRDDEELNSYDDYDNELDFA